MRKKIAYLCSVDTFPAAATRRSDAWEHDLTIGMLGMGLHVLDRAIEPVLWDDASVDFSRYEAAVIGTTWDYADRSAEFIARIGVIAQHTKVFNEPELIAWNARKTYLQDLAAAGCPTIPTLWLEHVDQARCSAAFDELGTEQIVIKPQIGAGAWRQVKLQRGEPWPVADLLPPGATMVQAFLPSAASEGEYSLLYFNRRFSHAVKKCAAPGDYRVQSSYGGYDVPHTPSAADLAVAEQILSAVKGALLYARVDLLRADDGQLRLIELELIEPYLYPVHTPLMGHAFAKAYAELLGL